MEVLLVLERPLKLVFFITLITSAIYVIVWLIEEHFFFPDFIDKYTAHEISKLQSSGISAADLADKIKDAEQTREMYKNPALKILMTFVEIFPVGVIVTLICSLILKRKAPQTQNS